MDLCCLSIGNNHAKKLYNHPPGGSVYVIIVTSYRGAGGCSLPLRPTSALQFGGSGGIRTNSSEETGDRKCILPMQLNQITYLRKCHPDNLGGIA